MGYSENATDRDPRIPPGKGVSSEPGEVSRNGVNRLEVVETRAATPLLAAAGQCGLPNAVKKPNPSFWLRSLPGAPARAPGGKSDHRFIARVRVVVAAREGTPIVAPELTRGADIKLNARVSLQSRKTGESLYRTLSSSGHPRRSRQAIILRLATLFYQVAHDHRQPRHRSSDPPALHAGVGRSLAPMDRYRSEALDHGATALRKGLAAP